MTYNSYFWWGLFGLFPDPVKTLLIVVVLVVVFVALIKCYNVNHSAK